MRFLFVGLDYGGTWKPTLGLAGMLVERGHVVVVLGSPSMRERCEAKGCEFIALPPEMDEEPGTAVEDDDWVRYVEIVCGPIIAAALAPAATRSAADVLVIDCLLFGALSAAELLDLPVAMIVHFLAYESLRDEPEFWDDEQVVAVNPTRAGLGLPPLPDTGGTLQLWSTPDVSLSLPPREWMKTSLPDNVVIVGPIASEPARDGTWDLPWATDDPCPLVVISMSSTYMHQESSLERLAQAANAQDVDVVLSLAGALPASAITVPDSVVVRDWINFETVLPHATLFATHGGQASVSAGLVHGIPMLLLPLGRDQTRVGAHVEESGAGILLEEDVLVADIAASMEALLKDPGYRERAEQLGASIQAFGNGRLAVDILEGLGGARVS